MLCFRKVNLAYSADNMVYFTLNRPNRFFSVRKIKMSICNFGVKYEAKKVGHHSPLQPTKLNKTLKLIINVYFLEITF